MIPRFLLLVAMVLCTWPSAVAGQALRSIALFPDASHPVGAALSGEMLLVTDTLRFQVESAVVRNELGISVNVESAVLGLGRRLPDGGWQVVHRGYAFPVRVSVEGGSEVEVNDLLLGVTAHGLLDEATLHPLVELVLTGPDGLEPSRSVLNETLGVLLGSGGGSFNKELLLSAEARRQRRVTLPICRARGCGSRIPGRRMVLQGTGASGYELQLQ